MDQKLAEQLLCMLLAASFLTVGRVVAWIEHQARAVKEQQSLAGLNKRRLPP